MESNNLIELQDFDKCDIFSGEIIGQIYTPNREFASVENNLGLHLHDGSFRSGGFCGWCWLKDKNGNIIEDDNGSPVVLHQTCRFEDGLKTEQLSAINNMICVIAQDEEFVSYINAECENKNDRLFTFFFDDPLIEAKKCDEDNRIVTVISYLAMLKKLTRRGLMKKTVKRSENFTGKLRGHIDMKKQISKNLSAGRKERIYCTYIEKSADITENRILKYTLTLAAEYLEKNFHELFNSFSGEIAVCRRRLKDVSEERFKPEDIDRIILPGMYKSYRPVLGLSKVIMTEISILNDTEKKKTEIVKIVPYAVNMPLLFECYCRKRVKQALEEINKQTDYRAGMLPYVADKKNLTRSDSKSGYACVGNKSCYIGGSVVPDIVIAYYKIKDGTKDEKPFQYEVYDVKYKKLRYKNVEENELEKTNSRRDDRLQLLAYQSIYQCKEIGHIFPIQKTNKKTKEKAEEKTEEKAEVINGKTTTYQQFFIDGQPIMFN